MLDELKELLDDDGLDVLDDELLWLDSEDGEDDEGELDDELLWLERLELDGLELEADDVLELLELLVSSTQMIRSCPPLRLLNDAN